MCFVQENLHSDDNGCNTFNVCAHEQLTVDSRHSTLTVGAAGVSAAPNIICSASIFDVVGITWIIRIYSTAHVLVLSSMHSAHTHKHSHNDGTWCFMLEQYGVIITRRNIPNANVTSTLRVPRNYYRKIILRHFGYVRTQTHTPTRHRGNKRMFYERMHADNQGNYSNKEKQRRKWKKANT